MASHLLSPNPPERQVGCLSFFRRKSVDSSSSRTDRFSCSLRPKDKQKTKSTSGTTQSSASEYAFDTTKQTIDILRQFSELLPVPGAKQVLEIGLLLMTTYEDVSALDEQVKGLNNRIGELMLVMVYGLADKTVHDIPAQLLRDIEKLGVDLQVIQQEIAKITAQNRLLLVFFKDVNRSKLDSCIERLNDALQSFNMSRTLDAAHMLSQIQRKLGGIQKGVGNIENKVDEMHAWMLKSKDAHNGQYALSLEEMPILPRLFGRQRVIAEVVERLMQPKPRIGVVGAGGMGKTSVAVAAMLDPRIHAIYKECHRFWVPCIGATSLLTFVLILKKSLRISLDTSSPLKDILDALKSTPEPRLVLLDNLETVMQLPEIISEGGKLSGEIVLNQLAAIPHISLVVTIRSNTLPSDVISWDLIHLEGVAREDARAIFTNICPSATAKPGLDELLEALGYMPYAVTLLAKQAVKSVMDPGDLLQAWKRRGAKALTKDLRDKMNRSLEFSIESPVLKDDPDAQRLLSILGKLPSGTTRRHLEQWWGKDIDSLSSAVATLNDTALVTIRHHDDQSPTLYVLPVVQSYLHEHPQYNTVEDQRFVLEACCRFVLDHASFPGDRHFKTHLEELDIEKTNILVIFLDATMEKLRRLEMCDDVELVLKAMVAFGWYQLRTKTSLELLSHLFEKVINEECASEIPILRQVAEARYCLGRMNWAISRYQDACADLEKARATFRKLGTPQDLVRAGDSTLLLADVQMRLNQHPDLVRTLVHDAEGEVGDDLKGKAMVLQRLGDYHLWIGQPLEGLEYAARARALLDQLKPAPGLELCHCVFIVTKCHASLHTDRWLDASIEFVELAKWAGLPATIAAALQCLAGCHIWLGNYEDAVRTLKEASVLCEQVGSPLRLAIVLALSGYAYAKMGDILGAKLAYEVATRKFRELERTEEGGRWLKHSEYSLQVLSAEEYDESLLEMPQVE